MGASNGRVHFITCLLGDGIKLPFIKKKKFSTTLDAGTLSKHTFFPPPLQILSAPGAPASGLTVRAPQRKPSVNKTCQPDVLQGSAGRQEGAARLPCAMWCWVYSFKSTLSSNYAPFVSYSTWGKLWLCQNTARPTPVGLSHERELEIFE